jgi:hypothetical protein
LTTPARRQALLEQIALCEGIVRRLKAQDPPPLALLAAVRQVLSGLESKLADEEGGRTADSHERE